MNRYALFAFAFFLGGCNLVAPFDPPSDEVDVIEQAQYLADNGDCVTARDLLINRQPKSDQLLFVQGFAQLCIAGSTLATIGTTIVNYTSTSGSDYTVIGQLARKLAPWSSSKNDQTQDAITSFLQISDPNRKAYTLLLARLTRMALLVAHASQGRDTVYRDDISTAANCTSAVACSAGGMSDADALAFKSEVTQLSNEVSSLSLAGLKDLSTALNSSFSALAGADAIRYTVRNFVVPAD